MDRIIEVKVSGNHLSKDNKVAGVRGEANVTNLHITFDEGWDGYSKKVTFWDALGNNPTKILIEDKREATVPIPGEAMTEAGNLTFVIDGYLGGKQQRSLADELEVKEAPMEPNAAEPVDPTPDLAAQLQKFIDDHKNDKDNPHETTAKQAGALPIEGGTLEGNLEISNVAPIVDLKPKYESGSARLLKSGDTTSLADRDEDAFDNVAINISNSKAKKDLTSAVVIYNVTNGFASSYKVYGEHNKPKASDVGAYSKEEEDTKLSGKVDKVTGKGLSSNDFTDEHKTKLEGMDEAVDEKLEVLSGKLDEHKTDTKTALNLKADKSNVYTKSETDSKLGDKANSKDVYGKYEIDSRLNNKADKTTTDWLERQLDTKAEKADISNVYKFEGSVDTFEDLPVIKTSKPNGTPARDEGYLEYELISEKQEVNISGTFDSEWSTHVEEVRMPVSDMELPAGYYIVEVVSEGLVGIHDNLNCSCSVSKGPGVQQYNVSVDGPTMIYLPTDSIFKWFNLSIVGDYLVVDIDAKIKGVTFRKVNYSEELGMNPDNYPSVEVGSVYNVLDSGMNYAYTGTVWDALGGEHMDLEARSDIERLETDVTELKNNTGASSGFDTVEHFEPVTIFDGIDAETTNGKLWGAGGLVDNVNYTAINKVFDVIPNATYRIENFNGILSFYVSEQYDYYYGVPTFNSGTNVKTEFEFTVPENRHKMALTMYQAQRLADIKLYRISPIDGETTETFETKGDLIVTKDNLDADLKAKLPLANKKIVNFGDSIFGMYDEPSSISSRLSKITGAEVYNCGFSGSRLATHSTAAYKPFSFCKLVPSIVSGDFTEQDTAIADYSSTLGEVYSIRLNTLKSIDFNKVDIVTIAYGTNDFAGGIPVDHTTYVKNDGIFAGALRNAIEALLNAYPNLQIFLCTPIFRVWYDATTKEVTGTSDNKTTKDTWGIADQKLTDFVSKVKEVGNDYHIPVIDNYNALGINEFNHKTYLSGGTDGTHPTGKGLELISRHIAGVLTTGGCPAVISGESKEIETALNSILAIQTSLIGGDDV